MEPGAMRRCGGSDGGRMATELTSTEMIPEITARIVRAFHPAKIILFGSHARGDARADSDIDLLVVLRQVEYGRR
jgi:predicted nucleotidyltransferase